MAFFKTNNQNMSFNAERLTQEYKQLIGWRQHFDTQDLQIDNALTESESGEYYQEQNAVLRLDYISACIPSNYELDEYLEDTVESSIKMIFADLIQHRQLNQYGKTLLNQSTLLNRYGWTKDKIVKQNNFVGFQIQMVAQESLQSIINEIGLQFEGNETFNLYLFHSSKEDPLQVLEVTTTGNGTWDWSKCNFELNSFESLNYRGGVFILGYYEEDVTLHAINYSNFDWNVGVCGSCNNAHFSTWQAINKYFTIYPIQISQSETTKGKMFDLSKVIYVNNKSFGLNLRLTTKCDLTDFFIENKFAFKKLLALKVTEKIMEMMKFSNQKNTVVDEIKNLAIRELEGDKDTYLKKVPARYAAELKAVSFNISGINSICLGCDDENTAASYSQL